MPFRDDSGEREPAVGKPPLSDAEGERQGMWATPGEPEGGARTWRGAFIALSVPNFRLFWFSQLISLTGTWIQVVGQAWLVLNLTNSPLALGTVTTLQFTPILLFSLVAGVVADRVPKRRFLVATQSAAALQALLLGVLVATGLVRLWHVYL
ncbi:MAG: MFS transporter, partial [Dehalococcoidia bacterium]